MKQNIPDDTFAKQTIVGHPASQPATAVYSYIRHLFLTPILPWPTIDLLAYPFCRLLANGRKKIKTLLTSSCLNPAWSERIAEKVKGYPFIVAFVATSFTECDLCLSWVELQAAFVEPAIESCLQRYGFPFTDTMTDNIIGVPLELNSLPVLFYPDIKRIVQVQIRQKRAGDSMNAKDNFEFSRVIRYQRRCKTK